MKTLFPYQEEALSNFLSWIRGEEPVASIILPPGCGKTYTAVQCLQELLTLEPQKKILWTSHLTELIDQAYEELVENLPEVAVSAEIAGRKGKIDSQIIVGSVQTLYRERANLKGWIPDIIVIDESHHNTDHNSQYRNLRKRWPNAKILGLSASLFRPDNCAIPMGTILVHLDITHAIEEGYLVPPVFEKVSPYSWKGIRSSGLLNLFSGQEATDKIFAQKIIKAVKEGKQGIYYCQSCAHAKEQYAYLSHYMRVGQVYYDTTPAERKEILRKFKNKEIDCLVNFFVFTEGLNVPHIQFIAINRETESVQALIQMIGRGLRKDSDKQSCLVLSPQDLSLSDLSVSEKDLYVANKEVKILGKSYSVQQIVNKTVKPVLTGVINKMVKRVI